MKGQGMKGTLTISGRKRNVEKINFGLIDGDICSTLIILKTNVNHFSFSGNETKTCF